MALCVGKFGTLAMDRLGAFSVMKCYEDLPLKKKEAVVHELLAVEVQLGGSYFPQLVMNTCHLFEYKQSREKWEALYAKQQRIADLFKDVVESDEAHEEGTKSYKKHKKCKKRKATQLTRRNWTLLWRICAGCTTIFIMPVCSASIWVISCMPILRCFAALRLQLVILKKRKLDRKLR